MEKAEFGPEFLAQRVATELNMEDLIVSESTRKQLEEVASYLRFGKHLKNDFGFGKNLMSGYRALFQGPSGTGKTMAACLLGKETGREVYEIHLTTVVSKYIGETEKNLSRIFDKAQGKDWILLFDEADALFGKRSEVKDAHDTYANQEVSYFLQLIASYDGLVILCSHLKKNIDAAFFRRFQQVIDFTLPDSQQRLQLWRRYLTAEFEYAEAVDVEYLAEQYELSPASIVNSLQYSILKCMDRDDTTIQLKDLREGIRREMVKEGRTLF